MVLGLTIAPNLGRGRAVRPVRYPRQRSGGGKGYGLARIGAAPATQRANELTDDLTQRGLVLVPRQEWEAP
jgi:hypothetical protein